MPVWVSIIHTWARKALDPCGLIKPVDQEDQEEEEKRYTTVKEVCTLPAQGTRSGPALVLGSLAVTCGAGRKKTVCAAAGTNAEWFYPCRSSHRCVVSSRFLNRGSRQRATLTTGIALREVPEEKRRRKSTTVRPLRLCTLMDAILQSRAWDPTGARPGPRACTYIRVEATRASCEVNRPLFAEAFLISVCVPLHSRARRPLACV
ncbi:hypothetical protein QBC41DRAFT_38041 [Cercophora samala]|uniref:Uncharacterized protein n=1 Tax=Cercophora samala TaxID=330535 RepID=A0AA39YYE2_9PEZI|nr:hypothetical protein QBC41DRAFT_38041 [Cercophora samala]